MGKRRGFILTLLIMLATFTACANSDTENDVNQTTETGQETEQETEQSEAEQSEAGQEEEPLVTDWIESKPMTQTERDSIVFGEVSPEQKYYNEVTDVAQYIQEMSIYDEELDSTYIVHITLPPNYDENKTYPLYMMTDGIWRLSDHAELRPMMADGERESTGPTEYDGSIEDIILVSIGYNYGIEAENHTVRAVELIKQSNLFLNFITDNLTAYLGEIYNIDYSRSALFGHSYGGVFMYISVFNHDRNANDPFHYYVMGSPSLEVLDAGWKDWKYGDLLQEYFMRNETFDKEIYLTLGDQETYSYYYMEKFISEAESYGITTIDYEVYKGDHSSYVKPMIRKSLLKYYSINEGKSE